MDAATLEQVKKLVAASLERELKAAVEKDPPIVDGEWTVKKLTADQLVVVGDDDNGHTLEFAFSRKQ